MNSSPEDFYEEREFEERSDNIDVNDLELWDIKNSHFKRIQSKLLGPGIKLFGGPRGTGKTHQMRIAYKKCIDEKNSLKYPLAIFSSFGKYYRLEPFLSKAPNAISIFHTWVLCKILAGFYQMIEDMSYGLHEFETSNLSQTNILDFIEKAEKAMPAELISHPLISDLTITKVSSILQSVVFKSKKKRIILLLDDAALKFTPDYLIEFFEIIRSLKSSSIAPKASVYPGTTQYGPSFHIGQDAEMVNCWLNVSDPTYATFMDSLINKRFASYTSDVASEIIELFKLSSFGIPRAFISLLRNYKSSDNKSTQTKFNSALYSQTGYTKTEYLSIQQKMPQYSKIIELGLSFFMRLVDELKNENKKLSDERCIYVGIDESSITGVKLADRMLRFLIEAGLLYEDIPVKHGMTQTGEPRVYKRYIPHFGFLIESRVFNKSSRGFSPAEVLATIRQRDKKHPLRRAIDGVLTNDEIQNLRLNLPACQKCGTPRLTEVQKFCHQCGSELVLKSAFENCMNLSIDILPITEMQKDRIKSVLGFTKIGELLGLQSIGNELMKIPRIGPITSEKIYNKTLNLVDEFLS